MEFITLAQGLWKYGKIGQENFNSHQSNWVWWETRVYEYYTRWKCYNCNWMGLCQRMWKFLFNTFGLEWSRLFLIKLICTYLFIYWITSLRNNSWKLQFEIRVNGKGGLISEFFFTLQKMCQIAILSISLEEKYAQDSHLAHFLEDVDIQKSDFEAGWKIHRLMQLFNRY